MIKRVCGFVITLSIFVLVGCATHIAEVYAPELIVPATAQFDTHIVQRGEVVAVNRRTGISRYLSEGLCFDDPVGSFDAFHVLPGAMVVEGQLLVTLDIEHLEEQLEEQLIRLANTRRDNALVYNIRQLDIEIMVFEHSQSIMRAAENADLDGFDRARVQELNIDRARLELRQAQERHVLSVRQAEQRISDLRRRIALAELRAPFDGRITFVGDFTRGDSVGVGVHLLYITDMSQVIIEAANLPIQDWPTPAPGRIPPTPWIPTPVSNAIHMQGRIGDMLIDLEYVPLRLEEREARPVRLVPVDENVSFPAGEYVILHFYTHNVPDALQVPVNAVFPGTGYIYVFRIIDGNMVRTPIPFYVRTDIHVAARLDGELREGDEIFVRA